MRLRRFVLVAMVVLALFGGVQTSHAALSAVDPGPYTAAWGFFPQWYQDTTGRALDLCLSPAVLPSGPACVLLADPGFNPALAIAFPGNFPSESFYMVADATLAGAGINKLTYRASLEAAFATGTVINGNQIAFARIRIRSDAPVLGQYTITHPYGVLTVNVDTVGSRAINVTVDVGLAPGIFTDALNGAIGPFLQAAAGLLTVGTESFIGDPNVTQAVIGSPFGTNFVRIQGPAGSGIDLQTPDFTLGGKISPTTTPLPTPLVVDRSTYSKTATLTQVDVFATSAPTATVSFTDGAVTTPMGGDAVGRFFGQELPNVVPPSVTVTASNVAANNSPASLLSNVTDVVSITRVEYSAGTLVIEASSSDESPVPTLTYGTVTLSQVGTGPTQSATVTGLVIPPATVTVTSAKGGSDTEDVVVLP
jgi:hypothetical protein